eukprot:2720064-Alexandrium_andersonii.AAC.1
MPRGPCETCAMVINTAPSGIRQFPVHGGLIPRTWPCTNQPDTEHVIATAATCIANASACAAAQRR